MFGPGPKFRNWHDEERYARFSLWLAVIVAVAVSFLIFSRIIHEKRISGREKQAALQESANDYVKRRLIEDRHEDCFRYNYRGATRSEPEFFDRNGYRNCLHKGQEEWLQEKRESRIAEKKEWDELQEAIK
ncbi:MAG: hypothetical protein AB7S75_17310 [Desulfococcaceae bacterium]